MNWMTLRMAAIPSFRDLHEESRPQAGSNLRRLPLELLEYALATGGVKADFGAVLEELGDARQDIQVFAGPEGAPVSRMRMAGEIDPDHARVTAVERLEPVACADGPCVEWMARCGGDGCSCHKYRVRGEQVRRRVLRAGGGGRKSIAILQCDLD